MSSQPASRPGQHPGPLPGSFVGSNAGMLPRQGPSFFQILEIFVFFCFSLVFFCFFFVFFCFFCFCLGFSSMVFEFVYVCERWSGTCSLAKLFIPPCTSYMHRAHEYTHTHQPQTGHSSLETVLESLLESLPECFSAPWDSPH